MVAKGRFAMRPGITLRRDYDAARLRGVARRTESAAQGRRLLAVAEIYDGGSRTKAACVGGVGLQTIRDWVLRFNAHGPEGLRADRQAPGHPGKLNTAQREALAAMVESVVVRFCELACTLCKLRESPASVRRELNAWPTLNV